MVRISRLLGIRRSEPTSKVSKNPPVRGRKAAVEHPGRRGSGRGARLGGLLILVSIASVLGYYSSHKYSATLTSLISVTRHVLFDSNGR